MSDSSPESALCFQEKGFKQGTRLHLEVLMGDQKYYVIWYLLYLGVVFKV